MINLSKQRLNVESWQEVPLTKILPTEPAVSSCPPLAAIVLFSQSPILASRAGWLGPATDEQTPQNEQKQREELQ